MRKILALLLTLVAVAADAATTRNDDSCDIAVLPAATLLLPYFEVDAGPNAGTARTTLFTIVNTTNTPQIARVTLWTDWAYPVMDFPIYLTGYDVHAINLRDVLVGGFLAPTSNRTTGGGRSVAANPKFLAQAATSCGTIPTLLPTPITADVRNAFTLGTLSTCGTTAIGGKHERLIGYATVDLVASCQLGVIPGDAAMFETLLFDNVLTGDWQIVDPNPASGNYAGGNPMVHIRAIPEGGPAGVALATNLPYTFYSRFAPAGRPNMDRRQPLPSVFTARFIQGGGAAFNTDFRIWREAASGATKDCTVYANNAMPYIEAVRFDERENPTSLSIGHLLPGPLGTMPSTSSISSSNANLFPPLLSGDVAGWMYLNLNNNQTPPAGSHASQNWVTVDMFAEGRYSVVFDATMLSNGCSPAIGFTSAVVNPIGPGPNEP